MSANYYLTSSMYIGARLTLYRDKSTFTTAHSQTTCDTKLNR